MTMIMMMLSMYLIKMSHPLSMVFILLLQTSMSAMMVGLLESFWFSYMLFLTMMSGMLVLFMYMSSIASNEMFNTSLKSIVVLFIFSPLSLIEQSLFNMNTAKCSMNHMQEYKKILEMMKLFSAQMMWFTIMMVIYLLFTMIVI